MAELQIFAGTVCDTSKLNLFIGPSGAPGAQIGLGITSTSGGTLYPINPAIAQNALGVPTVLLHGTTNWINGRNSGSGPQKLQPTGNIVQFIPDPSLTP